MTNKVKLNLGDIQKTLFLPLWGRATESRKKKPSLIDETAVAIMDQVDYDFSKAAENIDDLSMIAWVQRSKISDCVIRRFLDLYPDGTIVNIGCGLDTTFDRVDNGKLRWYDLDLLDVIELRKKFISEGVRRNFIATSFLETEWFNQIKVENNVFFLAAGVFYYFEPDQIQSFFQQLLDRFPGCELLFDVASEVGVRVANEKVIESSGLDEKSYLKWGLKNKKDILDWDQRIQLIRTYYYFRTLRLSLRNILMGLLSDLLGIQYMLHFKLGLEKQLK